MRALDGQANALFVVKINYEFLSQLLQLEFHQHHFSSSKLKHHSIESHFA